MTTDTPVAPTIKDLKAQLHEAKALLEKNIVTTTAARKTHVDSAVKTTAKFTAEIKANANAVLGADFIRVAHALTDFDKNEKQLENEVALLKAQKDEVVAQEAKLDHMYDPGLSPLADADDA